MRQKSRAALGAARSFCCLLMLFLVKIRVRVSQTFQFKESKFNDLRGGGAVRELSLH